LVELLSDVSWDWWRIFGAIECFAGLLVNEDVARAWVFYAGEETQVAESIHSL
jgi:hypothetical protein